MVEVDVTIVHTALRRRPGQVGLSVLHGECHTGHRFRHVIAGIGIHIVERRGAHIVAQYDVSIVIVVGQVDGQFERLSGQCAHIVFDFLPVEPHIHLELSHHRLAVVRLGGDGEAQVAGGAAILRELKAQVVDGCRCLVERCILLEEERRHLLVFAETLYEFRAGRGGVYGIEVAAAHIDGLPHKLGGASVVAHGLHIVGGLHAGLAHHLSLAVGLVDHVEVTVAVDAVELPVGGSGQGERLEVVGPLVQNIKLACGLVEHSPVESVELIVVHGGIGLVAGGVIGHDRRNDAIGAVTHLLPHGVEVLGIESLVACTVEGAHDRECLHAVEAVAREGAGHEVVHQVGGNRLEVGLTAHGEGIHTVGHTSDAHTVPGVGVVERSIERASLVSRYVGLRNILFHSACGQQLLPCRELHLLLESLMRSSLLCGARRHGYHRSHKRKDELFLHKFVFIG